MRLYSFFGDTHLCGDFRDLHPFLPAVFKDHPAFFGQSFHDAIQIFFKEPGGDKFVDGIVLVKREIQFQFVRPFMFAVIHFKNREFYRGGKIVTEIFDLQCTSSVPKTYKKLLHDLLCSGSVFGVFVGDGQELVPVSVV